jgi:cobalt-zinc-cadmium efflux system protein
MSLGGVPRTIVATDVRRYLLELPGVDSLHDLHIWPISTTETALTAHLVMSQGHPGDQFLLDAAVKLSEAYSIGHATLQVEVDRAHLCRLASDDVI